MDAGDYRRVMRSHAGAPAIVATGTRGARTGLTATAFCSVSDAPPTVLVCVNKSASAHSLIARHRSFSVNLLRTGQEDLALRFSGRRGLEGEQRFDGEWTAGTGGAPVLTTALASIECELTHCHDHESHSVFFGIVRHATTDENAAPLIYFRGSFDTLRIAGELPVD